MIGIGLSFSQGGKKTEGFGGRKLQTVFNKNYIHVELFCIGDVHSVQRQCRKSCFFPFAPLSGFNCLTSTILSIGT